MALCTKVGALHLLVDNCLSMLHLFSGRICSRLLKCWTLRVGDIETCAARNVVISWTFHGMKVYSRDSSIDMTIPPWNMIITTCVQEARVTLGESSFRRLE